MRSSTVLEELMNSSASNSPLQPLNESLKRVMDNITASFFLTETASVIEYSEQVKSNLQLQEVTQVLQFVYRDY